MADVKSLVKALKDMAVTQYGKGAPYRNALASALKGDMGGLQELNKPSPVMPNEALDVAMTFAPMVCLLVKALRHLILQKLIYFNN
jgi:hypothetical protein